MTIEKILQAKGHTVATISPDAPVSRAVDRLIAANIGTLVVSDDRHTILGLISERDVVRGMEVHSERIFELRVAQIMSKDVPTCAPEDPVGKAMATMTRFKTRHLPVVSDQGLVGIVSLGDLVAYRLEEIRMENSVLRDLYIAKS